MPEQLVIQILLLVAIGVVAALLTRSTADARHQAIRRILLVGFVAVAALSVLFPDWLTWLARRVGVGRGTDLLVYALVIAFLSSAATTYRRLSSLDRKITLLTRELALARARLDDTTAAVEHATEEMVIGPNDDADDGAGPDPRGHTR